MFKVLERIFRDKIATEQVSLSGSQRFRGKLSGSVEESLLPRCQAACPVGAFQAEGGKALSAFPPSTSLRKADSG